MVARCKDIKRTLNFPRMQSLQQPSLSQLFAFGLQQPLSQNLLLHPRFSKNNTTTMAKQRLVVFGATGNQGGSVSRAVLDDPELSKRYAVRAITRDTSTAKAQDLKSRGADVVAADLDDPFSLPAALHGANFVFAITATSYEGHTRTIETRQATALIDEAIKQGASYIIWSSMSHPAKISSGKLAHAVHFDVKAEIETYLRAQPVKSAFFAPGSFMQNFTTMMAPRPSPANDGSYVLANVQRPETRLPLIDVTESGAWVSAILADPEAYDGAFFAAAEGLYSQVEIAEVLSRVSGKTVRHVQVDDEVYKGYLPEASREMLFEMNLLFREYGYYGESMERDVQWAKEQARGTLTGLEGFLRRIGWGLE
ncbi:NAD(P)-binding protein [Karstenula rhodostoma CBS 690.94]|uniref:NAD(P)-binding protein n=1 Tax=Karstenula rhodostoma CBS 690.94 TaxID=1392251 RepID=A0A9P4P9N0_9PLEO|nr:NAD(P)-binding protein [Karstenula rhodostoma CBS 690.94]